MPKKRTLNLKRISGSASASASHSHGASASDSLASVNERLSELRKVETPETLQKKLDLAASVNQASVPPELRGILGVLETAPPKPKLGVRLRERMRTPGPAPPKSWLGYRSEWQPTLVVRGGKGRRKAATTPTDAERNRPVRPLRFELLLKGEYDSSRESSSGLLHLALKRLAEQWHLFDEEDYPALIEVPLRLRLRLLSYLGHYGPSIDAAALQALTAGSEYATHLDLAGLAGHAPLSLKKLGKVLAPPKLVPDWDDIDDIAESWDADESSPSILAVSSSAARFATLTHLCLSNPPSTASWRDLLSLAKNIPQLTHLSLAYWPRPTLTPNLVSATISSQGSPDVRAGGSHIYSNLDDDHAEPATLLRQLSHSLLRLQWLDVEGCAEWVPALGALAEGARRAALVARAGGDDAWSSLPHYEWNVFTETWKSLSYIRCSQGWLPSRPGIERFLPKDRAPHPLLYSEVLSHIEQFGDCAADDQYETELRKARIWAEREQRLFIMQRRIRDARRRAGCKPATVDYGWMQSAF